MIRKFISKTFDSDLRRIVYKTDFLHAQQYLEARVAADPKLPKENMRLF